MDQQDPSARPRWERRKDARPQELLVAALAVFVEKGYSGARLEDVAARAGVSKGTLYLYFENKEELLRAVVREHVTPRISQAQQDIGDYDGPSDALLASLIERWWNEYGVTDAGGLCKLMMAESGNFPEIARFFVEEVIEPWHRVLGTVIERGVARDEFRPVDVESFAEVISTPLVMLALWQHSFGPCAARPLDAKRYLATTIDMVLAALRAPRGDAKRTRRNPAGPGPARTKRAH